MGEQLKEIITQQQEYEYLKNAPSLCPQRDFFHSRMMNYCVIPKVKAARKKLIWDKITRAMSKAVSVFLLCLPLPALVILLNAPSTNTLHDSSPIGQMRDALKANDFQQAKQILDAAVAKYPDSYPLKAAYAEIDMAKGNYDNAVITLNDTIMNHFGVQNVSSAEYNSYYKLLKEISPDSLTTSREIYQNCIAQCDKYIAMHESVDKYLEREDYSSALQLLGELKAAGAYDGYLFYKYAECYNGLGLYDECAQYLLSLYDKSTGITDSRYPNNRSIINHLEKIKENVSPELRAKIDAKLSP